MRILIIGEWIFPYDTPRSFRTFELAKQLAKKHEVTLCALLGKYDYSKIEEETGLKIRTLGRSVCGNIDCDGNHHRSLIWGGLSRLFGLQFLLPQIELLPMVKNFVMKEQDNTDLIISIAKPYAIHWGVMSAKQKCKNFPVWISDCGDPFMGDPFDTPPSYFIKLEKKWSRMTDFITVPIENARNAYFKEFREKIHIIPQGFDLENIRLSKYKENRILSFIFAGNVILGRRDPSNFLDYLCTIDKDFKFIVYTRCQKYFEKYKEKLGDKLDIHDYIPRELLLKELSRADFLVNIRNLGTVQLPSKLIDYTLAKRPILEITTDFNEKEKVDEFFERNYENAIPDIDISQYDICNVSQKFIELFEIAKL